MAFYTAPNPLNKDRLFEQVRDELPDYMVPNDFIYLKSLPSTPNGKVDKIALEHMEYKEEKREIEQVKFETEVEEAVYQIWVKALGRKDFGLNDNFFARGGNSMLLVQTFYQIDNVYPDCLSIVDLFANPTVRTIASRIQKKIQKQPQPERMRLGEGNCKVRGAYKPFITTGKLTKQQSEALKMICKDGKFNVEEVLFSIYTFLCSKATGLREVKIQCILSQEKGVECKVGLEHVKDYNQLLAEASRAYREKTGNYELVFISEEDIEDEVYMSYSFNQELTNINLNMLDMCLSLETKDTEIAWKFIFNQGKIKQEFSKIVSDAFLQIVSSLLS